MIQQAAHQHAAAKNRSKEQLKCDKISIRDCAVQSSQQVDEEGLEQEEECVEEVVFEEAM